jgi:hypothetical protein
MNKLIADLITMSYLIGKMRGIIAYSGINYQLSDAAREIIKEVDEAMGKMEDYREEDI